MGWCYQPAWAGGIFPSDGTHDSEARPHAAESFSSTSSPLLLQDDLELHIPLMWYVDDGTPETGPGLRGHEVLIGEEPNKR